MKDRTLGNAQLRGKVLDARGVITVLGEMAQGGVDDASTLGLPVGAVGGAQPRTGNDGSGESLHA